MGQTALRLSRRILTSALALLLVAAAPLVWAQSRANVLLIGSGSPGASVVISFIQAAQCSSGTASCTISITPTTGHYLFVGFCGTGSSSLSLSDGSNTYNVANAALTGGNGNASTCATWLSNAVGSGALSLVCTSTSSVHQLGCICFEISKTGGTLSVDQTATGGDVTAVTSWVTSATSTTTQATELVVSAMGEAVASSTLSAGGSFTIPSGGSTNGGAAGQAVGMEYQNVSSTGTYSGAITAGTAQSYVSLIATLK